MAVTDPVLLRLLESCAGLMALPRPPALFESDAVNGPALYGLCRPALLLPIGMARAYSAPELRFVFLHELAHLKRRDMGVRWLVLGLRDSALVQSRSLVCLGRMRSDRELACDALALSRAETGEAKAYGETILRIISDLSGPALVPGLVGIAEDMRQMKTRMRMIAQFRRSSSRPFLPGLFFALLALANTYRRADQAVESSGAVPPVQTKGAGGQKAVAAAPERSSLVQDGRLLIELGKLDEAEAKLREALRGNANDRETLYYLGLIEDARRVAKADPARKGLGVIEPSKPGQGTRSTNADCAGAQGRRRSVASSTILSCRKSVMMA